MSSPILEIIDFIGDAVAPADFPKLQLRYADRSAAANLGLDQISDEQWCDYFGRFRPMPNNLTEPYALRYHGHQFGTYNPQLGDGRGFLYAQLQDQSGRWQDLGTKGSGQTPYSRQGDGRLTLKGAVREILASRYLQALGVSSSTTFSVIETGEELHRGDEPSPTRSAVLVRLQQSHLRFGSFQRLAYFEDHDSLARLAEHVASVYYPHITAEGADRVPALLEAIAAATGRMIGQWMAAGFVHGVMNTDNFNIAGETFDFGPYRFQPTSDPNFVAAYFDESGLYRFGRQPTQGLWALQQLASALLPLSDEDTLAKALQVYQPAYQNGLIDHTHALLGLSPTPDSQDNLQFLQTFYAWMTNSEASWPQTFFDWYAGEASANRAADSPQAHLYSAPEFADVRHALSNRKAVAPQRLDHPYFSAAKPTDLLIERIESIWAPIAAEDDWTLFDAQLLAIANLAEALGGSDTVV